MNRDVSSDSPTPPPTDREISPEFPLFLGAHLALYSGLNAGIFWLVSLVESAVLPIARVFFFLGPVLFGLGALVAGVVWLLG